ncbi:uncharacterized protein LOC128232598 [Mya arenaria]|uniref:uncharacterized protein LOC128232598 n=1 Tax=Mya arenaria TaxID=6604 RepID=UPI0022E66F7D|nr:uncharacterized protein LOC128232598 [Mya arenaria]
MNKTVLCLFMCLNMAALCRCSHVLYKSRVITLNVVSSDCNTPVNDVTIKCPTGESLRMRSTGLGNYQILTKKFPIKLELSKFGFMTQTLIVRSKMTMVQLRCVGAVCTANTVRISVSSSCSKAVTNVKIESQNEQIKALTSPSPGIYDVSVCSFPVTLSFQKSGLVGQTKIFAGTMGNVELLCKAAPLLLEHVQSKVRSLGDDVKFCCWADKMPELTFDPFMWFFNGNPIPGEEAMQLEITNIEASNAGLYSCKASITVDGVTEAVMSEGASLTLVGDENDFNGDLLSNMVMILEGPPVCVFDAQLCNPRPCQTNPAGSQECKDDGYVCPDQIDFVTHMCPSGVTLQLPRVMSCKCCQRPNVEYKGTVKDPDGTVLSGIKLTIKDQPGTPTEKTSNAAGMFFGSAIPEIRRLVIQASDSTGTFLPTTKVVDVSPGVIGPIEEINVVMFPLASPVAIDARVGSNLSLSDMPLTPGAGLGSVIIPGGVLFNMDGTPYNGIAYVHLTVLSPVDLNAIDNAPGEFAVLTADGKRTLVTGGVFNIKITGQNGMNLISMPITVTGATGMHLFDLDTFAGVWRTSPGSTTTRRKRSSHIQEIGDLDNLDAVWYNIDKFMEATDNIECWIKMKVFDAAAPDTELQAGVEFKPYILQYTNEDPPKAIKPGALVYVNPINDKCYRVACDQDPDNNPSTFLVLGMTTKFSVDGFDVPITQTLMH